jgi:ribosomal protein S18 acetylase RimI-like enzyme
MRDRVIRPARNAAEVAEAKTLFLEYADSLDFDLCFQGFDDEIADFPGRYAPPAGELLLAEADGAVAGAVGARPLEDGVCEMKRLYVRPAYRGRDLGRGLAAAIVDWARQAGYQAMRLDTLGSMTAAQALYRELGFRPIGAYYDNPKDDLYYFELDLTAGPSD